MEVLVDSGLSDRAAMAATLPPSSRRTRRTRHTRHTWYTRYSAANFAQGHFPRSPMQPFRSVPMSDAATPPDENPPPDQSRQAHTVCRRCGTPGPVVAKLREMYFEEVENS